MRRDPRIDPQEGDVLYQANGTRELHVEKVDAEEVGYRVTDGNGGLLAAYRMPLANWRETAPYTCDESEMFCPECYGRGTAHYVESEYANGLERCRMCGGTGRMYFKNAPDDCPASYAPPCEPGCDRACPVGGEREPAKKDQDGHEGISISQIQARPVPRPKEVRPMKRSDCVNGPRPCPWVRCRHHLAVNVTRLGRIVERDNWTEDGKPTCSLDVADLGPQKLQDVGDVMEVQITRERVRQIEEQALDKIRAMNIDWHRSADEQGVTGATPWRLQASE